MAITMEQINRLMQDAIFANDQIIEDAIFTTSKGNKYGIVRNTETFWRNVPSSVQEVEDDIQDVEF